jgi:hypothetical protein
MLLEHGGGTGSDALRCMTKILARREIYRHMPNAGDRLAHPGQTLHDIIVKIAREPSARRPIIRDMAEHQIVQHDQTLSQLAATHLGSQA